MRRWILWIVAAAFIVLWPVVVWWFRPAAPAPSPAAPPPQAVKVPANLDFQKLSQTEVRELASHFDATSPKHSFQWNTEVMPGESVITDCYEGQSGEFVFSKLTPKVTQDKFGAPQIAVQTDTFIIDFVGNKGSLSDAPVTMTMAPGGEGNAEYFADGGRYRVFVKATPSATSPKIALETHGDFAELPAETPAAAEEKDQ